MPSARVSRVLRPKVSYVQVVANPFGPTSLVMPPKRGSYSLVSACARALALLVAK